MQESLKNNLKISEKPRPTIYAVAVIEEPNPSDKSKKPKTHARITSKGSLRLAHSAEDISTLDRMSRRGKCEGKSLS